MPGKNWSGIYNLLNYKRLQQGCFNRGLYHRLLKSIPLLPQGNDILTQKKVRIYSGDDISREVLSDFPGIPGIFSRNSRDLPLEFREKIP
jgi:hypothetical protein